LLPHMIHMALYVLNTTRQHMVEEQLIKTFIDAPVDSWIGTCYEVNGPLFATVLNMFVSSLEAWQQHRSYFIKRLLLLAHVRKLSGVPMNTLVSGEAKEYDTYKPALMYYSLVNQLHHLCKGKLTTPPPEGEEWPQQMSTYLRNNDDVILKGAERILKRFEEDVLPCESFSEFCDVEGLLEEIPFPDQFIKEVLAPYCVDSTEVFC
jgi:E3 ubiquitin-protein ligase UBR4